LVSAFDGVLRDIDICNTKYIILFFSEVWHRQRSLPFFFFLSKEGGSASSFAGSLAPSSVGGGGSFCLVFFFGGILFALLVTENNNISNDVGDSNHGKWREIPGKAEKRDSE
jgi:hypothetical protein